jgi:hypothetical protein
MQKKSPESAIDNSLQDLPSGACPGTRRDKAALKDQLYVLRLGFSSLRYSKMELKLQFNSFDNHWPTRLGCRARNPAPSRKSR